MATKKKEHESEKHFYKGCSLVGGKKFKQKLHSSITKKTQLTVNVDNFDTSIKIAFVLNFIVEYFMDILDEKNVYPEGTIKLMQKYKDDLVLLLGNMVNIDYQLFRSIALGFITSDVLKYLPECTINTISSNLDQHYLEFTNELNSKMKEIETESENVVSQNAIQESPIRIECREVRFNKKSAFCGLCGSGEYINQSDEFINGTITHKCNNCGNIKELPQKYPAYIEEFPTQQLN